MRSVILALVAWLAGASAAGAVFVQVSGVSDIALPNWSLGDGSVTSHIDLCIYSLVTLPLDSYAITVTGSNGFQLQNGAATLPYSLAWDDGGAGNLGGAAGAALTSGAKLAGRGQGNAVSPVCLGGPTARLTLAISQAAMEAAVAGPYNGSVTLLLSPN